MFEIDRYLSVQPVDDWTMLAFLILFLASCLVLGPQLGALKTSLVYVYRIKNLNGEFKTMNLSPLHSFAVAIVSVLSVSFASALTGIMPEKAGTHVLMSVLHAFVYIAFCILLKQQLSRMVNNRMYTTQKINVKPLRWNALNLTMLSFLGILSLAVGLTEMFIPIPSAICIILLSFFVLLCLYGEIIKAKSSLFSTRCKLLGIILYLCALEIAPLALALFLLVTNTLFL